VDTAIGLPYNITSYSLFLIFIAHITNLKPRRLIMTFGDTHIYEEHVSALKEQVLRPPYDPPKLRLLKKFEGGIDEKLLFLESLKYSDIELLDYKSHPAIKMQMIV
jgi:thymidylate synthase